MKNKNTLFIGLSAFFVLALFPAFCFSQDVRVYGEAAWRDNGTDQDVVVYIYADIEPAADPLISFGVRLTYPSDLTLDTANTGTNKDIWYFGVSSAKEDYTDVYEESNTEVVLIGGKLDTGAPTAGVSGDRILLAKVQFTFSSGAAIPPALGLTFGRPGEYKDFVDNDGTVLDDLVGAVVFEHPSPKNNDPIIMAERGDADANGYLTTNDFFQARTNMTNNIYTPYADCDADGFLTTNDFYCIRANM